MVMTSAFCGLDFAERTSINHCEIRLHFHWFHPHLHMFWAGADTRLLKPLERLSLFLCSRIMGACEFIYTVHTIPLRWTYGDGYGLHYYYSISESAMRAWEWVRGTARARYDTIFATWASVVQRALLVSPNGIFHDQKFKGFKFLYNSPKLGEA